MAYKPTAVHRDGSLRHINSFQTDVIDIDWTFLHTSIFPLHDNAPRVPNSPSSFIVSLAYAAPAAEIPPLDCLAINSGRLGTALVFSLGDLCAQPYIVARHVLSACSVCNACIAILTFAHLSLASLFSHNG
jgi:hypothetical protein